MKIKESLLLSMPSLREGPRDKICPGNVRGQIWGEGPEKGIDTASRLSYFATERSSMPIKANPQGKSRNL